MDSLIQQHITMSALPYFRGKGKQHISMSGPRAYYLFLGTLIQKVKDYI